MLPQRERIKKKLKHFQNWLTRPAERSVAVFVFGDQRSGTNMLKECFTRTRGTAVYNESDDDAFDDCMLKPLETIDRLVEASHASHVIFKTLCDSARARELLDRYPDSRGIWIYRDYRDVVNSAVRTSHWRSPLENLRLTLEEPAAARWRRMNLSDQQLCLLQKYYDRGISDDSARALIWYTRNDLLFTQGLADDRRMIVINYERLVTAPAEELRSAWAHVGLPLAPEYYSHFSPKSIGRHGRPEIDEEIALLADSMLERLEAARTSSLRNATASDAIKRPQNASVPPRTDEAALSARD